MEISIGGENVYVNIAKHDKFRATDRRHKVHKLKVMNSEE